MASIVVGLLLGHSQSIVIPGSSFGEVSKLANTERERESEREEGLGSINDESEVEGEGLRQIA